MILLISIFVTGFIFGFAHAFEADHIAAISAITSKSPNEHTAVMHGIKWGIGHTAALAILFFAYSFLGWSMPLSWFVWLERAVAVLVIVLGIQAVRHALAIKNAVPHGPLEHSHPPMGRHRHGSIGVGLLHGFAGSAALLTFLFGSAASPLLLLLFLVFFGIGTMFGMGCVGFLIAKGSARFQKYTGFAAGVFSFIVGIGLLFPEFV